MKRKTVGKDEIMKENINTHMIELMILEFVVHRVWKPRRSVKIAPIWGQKEAPLVRIAAGMCCSCKRAGQFCM